MAESQQEYSARYIARGPLLVSAVCISLITPFFLQFSTNTLVHLAIATFGVLCFVHDVLQYVEKQTKRKLHQWLDDLVLDDVLRALYDPENGLISFVVGGFIGACSMYGLRLNEEQKTRLVQSSLSVNYNQANALLMNPGGCKVWLPPAIQSWLDDPTSNIQKIEYEAVDEESSDDSVPASPAAREVFTERNLETSEDTHSVSSVPSSSCCFENEFSCSNPPLRTPTDPMTEMFHILRGLALEQLKPYFRSIPESVLENIGISAMSIVGLQLLFRRRQQSTLRFMANIALSGVASGAMSMVIARRMIIDSESFQAVFKTVVLNIWQKLKSKAISREGWQSTLAILVMLVLGRGNRQNNAASILKDELNN
eukprot:scaffold22609_cov142-Cylindrotheca_fusiformis.AAC.6